MPIINILSNIQAMSFSPDQENTLARLLGSVVNRVRFGSLNEDQGKAFLQAAKMGFLAYKVGGELVHWSEVYDNETDNRDKLVVLSDLGEEFLDLWELNEEEDGWISEKAFLWRMKYCEEKNA